MSKKPANSLSRKALWGLLSLILLLQTACKGNQPASEAIDQKNQNVQTGSSLQTRVSKKKTEAGVSPTRHKPVELTKKLINNLKPKLDSLPLDVQERIRAIFEDFREALLSIHQDNSKINTERVVDPDTRNREISVLSAAIMCGLRPAFLQTLKELGADANDKEGKGFSPACIACMYGSFKAIEWLLDTEDVDLNDLKNHKGEPVNVIKLVFYLLQNPRLKAKQKKKVIERLVNAYEGELSVFDQKGSSILKDIATSNSKDADKLASIKMLFTIPELDIPDTELHHALVYYLLENEKLIEMYAEIFAKMFKEIIEGKEGREADATLAVYSYKHGRMNLTVLGALVYANVDNMRYLEALFTHCPDLIGIPQKVGGKELYIQDWAKKSGCSKKIKKKLEELLKKYLPSSTI